MDARLLQHIADTLDRIEKKMDTFIEALADGGAGDPEDRPQMDLEGNTVALLRRLGDPL